MQTDHAGTAESALGYFTMLIGYDVEVLGAAGPQV